MVYHDADKAWREVIPKEKEPNDTLKINYTADIYGEIVKIVSKCPHCSGKISIKIEKCED